MQSWVGRACRIFWRDERGVSAMIFALFLPVLMLLIGGAIDFSRLLQLRMELQDACDSASVGAVGVNSSAFQAGIAMSGNGPIAIGSTQAKAIFNSNMPANIDLSGTVFTASVSKTNTVITSVSSVKSSYKSTILGLFVPALANIPINITSTSSATVPPYINFYLLLDNTPSMGLGATPADITALQNATNSSIYGGDANCAFACHELDMPQSGTGEDFYDLARDKNITLRIDVVRQATQNLMTTATNTETLPKQFGMAIYDFGTDATLISATAPTAYQVSALTTNLTTAATNAGTIDLMTVPAQNYNNDEQTNSTSVLAGMNSIIPTNGSGMTAASPEEVLFMVTDGVNDGYGAGYNNGASNRRITPFDTTSCTTLKNRGVRIAVLYTTYQPVPANSFFVSWVQQYLPILQSNGTSSEGAVATALQSCATSGLYFEVSPTQGISAAMSALFQKVVSVVRINS